MEKFRLNYYNEDTAAITTLVIFLSVLRILNSEVTFPVKPDDDRVFITLWGLKDENMV